MTTTACAEDWREIADKANREAREWRENFATLQRALVGDTGASGIEVAHALRKDAERYRWLRHGDNDERVMAFAENGDPYLPRNGNLDKAVDHWIAYDADEINHTVAALAVGAA